MRHFSTFINLNVMFIFGLNSPCKPHKHQLVSPDEAKPCTRPNLTELLYFEPQKLCKKAEASDIVVASQSQISAISIKSLSIQLTSTISSSQTINNSLSLKVEATKIKEIQKEVDIWSQHLNMAPLFVSCNFSVKLLHQLKSVEISLCS